MEDIEELFEWAARLDVAESMANRIMRIQQGDTEELPKDVDAATAFMGDRLIELDRFFDDDEERAKVFGWLAHTAWQATVDDAIVCSGHPAERTDAARNLALSAMFSRKEAEDAFEGLDRDERMALTYEYLGLIGHILRHAGAKPGADV